MQANSKPLQGQVAIITGAGRGIGKAIAMAYADAGAAVCCAARTEADVREVVQAIEQRGGRAIATVTDVSDLDSLQQMVAATEEAFGGVDIVLVNAGVTGQARAIADGDPEVWRKTID